MTPLINKEKNHLQFSSILKSIMTHVYKMIQRLGKTQYFSSLLSLPSPSLEPNWSTKHTIVQFKTIATFTTSTRPLCLCIATIKNHYRHTIEYEPPLRSVSFSQSFCKTNAANLFFGLQYAKPKSLISIFGDTYHHSWWPLTHMSSQIPRWLVVHKTNATDLFFGLWHVKPKKPTSILSLTRLQTWPEVWLSIHMLSKTTINCCSEFEEPMPSSCTLISKKGLLLLLFLKT